ncbi:MAG: NAD-dependent deacylase [Solirubrobacterales bacterium]|nr:NAD-dependent deacylase [Solirubrobacterales bacterium]
MPLTPAGRVAELIRESDSVVALTGAGISVPSGISDFRSAGSGLWENVNPMEVAHIDAWRSDPKRFWEFYGQRFGMLADKQPNQAHRVLARLEQRGLLDAVLTQNIDMLHQKAGTADPVELHGTIRTSSCLSCGHQVSLEAVVSMLEESPDGIPRCVCGEPLKPDVVLFGEMLPEAAINRAFDLAAGADLMICIGTSLEVFPVASLPEETARNGGRVVLVTQGPTPWDGRADVKLDNDVEDDLAAVLGAL